MSICEDCILYGRCDGRCGDTDSSYDMYERENDERDTYNYYDGMYDDIDDMDDYEDDYPYDYEDPWGDYYYDDPFPDDWFDYDYFDYDTDNE